MNERIKLLAQQSQLAELYDRYVEQCMKNADDDILDYDVIVKEFAELIVRECAGRVDHILRERQAGSGTMGDDIREHFGVEE
jgi:hypothetical protein